MPWRRAWQSTPVSLPGEFHGQRSLVGYSPRGHKELDMTEWLTLTLFMIHFKLILVKGIYTVSSRLIFFHDQLLQHYLLKSLSFLHCIVLVFFFFFWSKISWQYLCGSDSSLSILCYWFICLFFHPGHTVPIAVVLQPVWKPGSVSVQLLFSFNSGSFARNCRISLLIHL